MATPGTTSVWDFEITGADLDGIGDGNDTMWVSLQIVSTPRTGWNDSRAQQSGSTDYFSVKSRQPGQTEGNTFSYRMNAGESLTFTPGAVTYQLNGSGPIETGNFTGFTEVDASEIVAGTIEFNGDSTTSAGSYTFSDPVQTLVGEVIDGAWRFGLIDFELNAEPLTTPTTDIVVSAPTTTAIGTNGATLGATIESGSGITDYGTSFYEPGGATDSLTITGSPTTPHTFTHARTGMSPGTLYHTRAWATNGTEGTVWSAEERPFVTEPLQATNVDANYPTSDSIKITWDSDPSSDGVLVVAREGSPVAGAPVDNGNYGASAIFGSGIPLGGGYVVYSGSGSSVTITGLSDDQTYHLAVFSYATGAGLINYQQDGPGTPPALLFPSVTITDLSAKMQASSPNGTVAVTSSDPWPGPFANPGSTVVWDLALTGADLDGVGGNNDSMWVSISITSGKRPGAATSRPRQSTTTHHFGVTSDTDSTDNQKNRMQDGETLTFTPGDVTYELNGSGTINTGSFIGFQGAYLNVFDPTLIANGASFSASGNVLFAMPNTELVVAAGAPPSEGRLRDIDMKLSTISSSASPIEVDNLTVTGTDTDTTTLGATVHGTTGVTSHGTDLYEPGGPVDTLSIAGAPGDGLPFSHLRTGLNTGTLYQFRGWAQSTNQGKVLSEEEGSFLTEPSQASDVQLTNVTGTSMTVSWTPGAFSDGSVVVVRKWTPVVGGPRDQANYAANPLFAAGPDAGEGFVIYSGPATSVNVSGLSTDEYHVAVFAYAAEGGLINYQQDVPSSAIKPDVANSPFLSWKLAEFTPSELEDPAISGNDADFDFDGLPTLLEYLLGLNPKSRDTIPAGSIMDVAGTDRWVVEFNHYASRNDADLVLEWSTTLTDGSWLPIARSLAGAPVEVLNGATLVGTPSGSEPTTTQVAVPSGSPKGFIRWVGSQP